MDRGPMFVSGHPWPKEPGSRQQRQQWSQEARAWRAGSPSGSVPGRGKPGAVPQAGPALPAFRPQTQ